MTCFGTALPSRFHLVPYRYASAGIQTPLGWSRGSTNFAMFQFGNTFRYLLLAIEYLWASLHKAFQLRNVGENYHDGIQEAKNLQTHTRDLGERREKAKEDWGGSGATIVIAHGLLQLWMTSSLTDGITSQCYVSAKLERHYCIQKESKDWHFELSRTSTLRGCALPISCFRTVNIKTKFHWDN